MSKSPHGRVKKKASQCVRLRNSLCWTWKNENDPNSGLDPKPLSEWAIQFRLSKDGLIQAEPFDEMDWEKFIFFTGLIEAVDTAEEKAMKDAKAEMQAKTHNRR